MRSTSLKLHICQKISKLIFCTENRRQNTTEYLYSTFEIYLLYFFPDGVAFSSFGAVFDNWNQNIPQWCTLTGATKFHGVALKITQ